MTPLLIDLGKTILVTIAPVIVEKGVKFLDSLAEEPVDRCAIEREKFRNSSLYKYYENKLGDK